MIGRIRLLYIAHKGLILPSVDHLFMLSELLNVHMEDFLVKKGVLPMVYDSEKFYLLPRQKRLMEYYKRI